MRTARRNRTALILVCIIVFALAIALIIGLLAKKEPAPSQEEAKEAEKKLKG